jgi:hypothetical protein
MPKYKTGSIKGRHIDLEEVAFAIDTALSWEGRFPKPGRGDYLVTIGSADDDPQEVLVSRRYVGAVNANNAARIALNAFAERHSYATDDEGKILQIEVEFPAGKDMVDSCWVESVKTVT